MASGSEIRERQENELEAIKAIYINEVTDLRKGGGFKWELPTFSIKILPQRGSSFGVTPADHYTNTTVRLVFRLPPKYPDVIPEIKIEQAKGLSDDEVQELKDKLVKVAGDSLGEVMILNLAQYAETFLYEHQKRPTGSFYDEMLERKKLLEEEHNQVKDEQEKRIKVALKEELQRKQDILKEEVRRRKEMQLALQEESSYLNLSPGNEANPIMNQDVNAAKKQAKVRRGGNNLFRRSEGSESSVSESGDSVTLEFNCLKSTRSFQRGELLGSSDRGSVVYAGMDCKTGSLVAISEYEFHLRVDKKNRVIKEIGTTDVYSMETLIKQLSLLEVEFKLLLKLDHPNLSTYVGTKTVQEDNANVVCRISQEFLRGTTLHSYLQDSLTLDLGWIRNCANGILQGLEYLHSSNIVHRYLRDTSVFINHYSEIKIADYGLERKLSELYQAVSGGPEVNDQFAPSIGRGAKKGDIYRFGILILSLVKGEAVSENPPDIPSALPVELQDFLKMCLTNNENARWSAAQLLEHTFLKLPITKQGNVRLPKGILADNNDNIEAKDPTEDEDKTEVQGFTGHIVKGHSRLQTEFEVLVWLGRGAFGDVLKVRNKLDGRVYALKRIKLNPKNKVLNKKITREVKLLSQLNHENVVRYFNSWMETVLDYDTTEESTDETRTTPSGIQSNAPKDGNPRVHFDPAVNKGRRNSLDLSDNVEALAPADKDAEWSVSVRSTANKVESEDDSDDEDDIFGTSFLCLADDESDDIMFEGSTNKGDDNHNDSSQISSDFSEKKLQSIPDENAQATNPLANEMQFMYIQMEFCEKSTLRSAIDCGLHLDKDRTWRLFREIIEGLVHIHQQGMIHRDLKPVNIFLDCHDSVKIGDFGLATGNILQKIPVDDIERADSVMKGDLNALDFTDGSLTGQVGTRSYIAVELLQSGTKAMYNQKVDIYSLGIIFFEMIYHPVDTGMERVRLLAGLRQPQVAFPSDFDEFMFPKEAQIVRWLMKHDPSERPTSAELLQSDLIPPPQMEETEIQDMFRFTISNPQSKAYKYLMKSCFKQSLSPADEIIYTSMDTSSFSTKTHFKLQPIIQRVKDIMTSTFRNHGAIELIQCPLLLPKSSSYQGSEASVELMTSNGQVVRLPHDLRVPFARYVVSNNITKIKRYSIEKVFRERKVFGFHPRELVECSFDSISLSQGCLLEDAEVLSIVFEIINELPWLKDKSYTIQLGHTNLLKAILIHFSVQEVLFPTVVRILADLKVDKRSKSQVHTHLVSLSLPDQFIMLLFNLLEMEGPLSKVSNTLKGIIKKRGEAASLIKEGLHELELLVGHIEAFGLKCSVVVTPTLVFGGNIYNGLIYQVICDLKGRKNRKVLDVIAAGGRYDALLHRLRKNWDMSGTLSKDFKQFGVGISISLDKLVSGIEIDDSTLEHKGFRNSVEVVICSFGTYSLKREKVSLMKEFWSFGIACIALDTCQSLEAAEDECREVGAKFLIILKDSELVGSLRLRCFEKERVQEKKMARNEIVEYIRRSCRNPTEISTDASHIAKSEAPRQSIVSQESSSGNVSAPGRPLVNITFLFSDGKEKNTSWKRRQENQMITHLSEVLPRFSKQHLIELIGLEANATLINTMPSYFQVSDKEQFNKNVADFLEIQSRQRKYMKTICDEIFELLFEKHSAIIILFGLIDNSYRVIL